MRSLLRTSWPDSTVLSFTHALRIICCRSSTVSLVRASFMVGDTIASFGARIIGHDHAATIDAEDRAHARRAPAPDLPRPARDHREGRMGRADLAREGQALRAARRSS